MNANSLFLFFSIHLNFVYLIIGKIKKLNLNKKLNIVFIIILFVLYLKPLENCRFQEKIVKYSLTHNFIMIIIIIIRTVEI